MEELKKDVEADDPMEFMGLGVPAGPEADEEMTRAVVEEYLLFGYDRERLLALFRDPFYAGTHRILKERGEPFVASVIDAVVLEWSPKE